MNINKPYKTNFKKTVGSLGNSPKKGKHKTEYRRESKKTKRVALKTIN